MRPKWSSRCDRELLSAKLEIENAKVISNSSGLYAPVYRQASKFSRHLSIPEFDQLKNQLQYNCIDQTQNKASRITAQPMKNCIRSLCNADVAKGFQIGKDTTLPATYIHSVMNPLIKIAGKPPSERTILAFFAGGMHGYLRPIQLKHWEKKEPGMKIFGQMARDAESKRLYMDYMNSSKYCTCARGYEVYSPRIVEAIFSECVPVIISDNYVPPFFEVLNWEAFSVFVRERDVPNLRNILLSISEEKYLALHLGVKKVQQHFLWHKVPVKYDLFHMILHSIWNNRIAQIRLM
ncbi:putative glycosyltransferase [Trifolium repens]|nr:putative glycosyltransferase [Trifolium repens]